MEITEVRISRRTQGEAKLKGYAAVTFDDVFVVRDLKIIEGKSGLFVAMPSQKIYESCTHCKKKNPARSRFCNECGQKQIPREGSKKEIHRDIAHPVNSDMRNYLQKVIIEAFHASQDSSKSSHANSSPDYLHGESSSESGEEDDYATPEFSENAAATPQNYSKQQPSSDDYLSRPSLKDSERITKEEDLKNSLLDTIE